MLLLEIRETSKVIRVNLEYLLEISMSGKQGNEHVVEVWIVLAEAGNCRNAFKVYSTSNDLLAHCVYAQINKEIEDFLSSGEKYKLLMTDTVIENAKILAKRYIDEAEQKDECGEVSKGEASSDKGEEN